MAHADVALFLEQPYGILGDLSPTGHSAIYLSRVCAESPVKLRRCSPSESGVVISRYSGVGNYDWIAIPLIPYLYAVSSLQEVPITADSAMVAHLRDQYRRAHLEKLVPDDPGGKVPGGEWVQLLGASYIRKMYVFEIQTSLAQDDLFIRRMNSRPNKKHFNYFFENCANFSKSVLNFYYPHSIHRSVTADMGLVTPKQVAKSLASYADQHRDLEFSQFAIPQVPGTVHRSHKIYGVAEALVKKKQFAIPLIIWQPYVAVALVGLYLTRGRFNPEKNSVPLNQDNEVQALLRNAAPQSEKAARSFRLKKSSIHSVLLARENPHLTSQDWSRTAVQISQNSGVH